MNNICFFSYGSVFCILYNIPVLLFISNTISQSTRKSTLQNMKQTNKKMFYYQRYMEALKLKLHKHLTTGLLRAFECLQKKILCTVVHTCEVWNTHLFWIFTDLENSFQDWRQEGGKPSGKCYFKESKSL